MRYYLITIQYNKDKDAENRTIPKAYDTKDEAIAAFHKQMGADMTNPTLGWALNMVINSEGGIIKNEKWSVTPEPAPEPEVIE